MKTNASLRPGSLSVRPRINTESVDSSFTTTLPQPASIQKLNGFVMTIAQPLQASSSSDFLSCVLLRNPRLLVMLLAFVLLVGSAHAQFGQIGRRGHVIDEPTRCGSPRFLVKTGDTNAFALKSTDVSVNIIGVLADVQIRQVYRNTGKTPVEATYIFPASTRAAVYAMTMQVRDRITNAVIKEKQQAKQIYQQAVASGHTASLLEQLKPNVFSMSVGNILSNDSVVVNLHYSEAISYAEGEYEFVYPAVVGPRYAGGVSPEEFQTVLSSLDLPKEIPGEFHIHCNLATGVSLKKVESPSHQLDVTSINAKTNAPASMSDAKSITTVSPSAKDAHTGNRDFVLHYRLSGPAIESGLLLSKDKDENFFMLMVQPPRQVEIPNILPREYVFIVDVSGSMWGKPLETAKKLMSDLLDKLRPTDKFNILAFSGSSLTLSDNSLELTSENKERARTFLNNGYGGGGTEILPALKRALAMNAAPGYSRNFVVITDGFVQCEPEVFDLVRANLNKANVYAFGIGSSVNRYLMEGLARAGNAEPLVVEDMSAAPKMAEKFREYIEAPVLTHISVDFGGMQAYDVDPVSIPDVSAKRPIIVFGKWRGEATGQVHLHATSAEGAFDVNMDLAAEPIRPENSALRYLWARNRIRMIQDGALNNWGYQQALSQDKQKLITQIGLTYNLLTDYTSFVAVDSVVSVKQSEIKEFASVDNLKMQSTLTNAANADTTNTFKTPSGTFSQQALTTTGVLSTGGGLSIRGGRGTQTKMMLDGQDVSDPIVGGFGGAGSAAGDVKYAPMPAKSSANGGAGSASSASGKSNSSGTAEGTFKSKKADVRSEVSAQRQRATPDARQTVVSTSLSSDESKSDVNHQNIAPTVAVDSLSSNNSATIQSAPSTSVVPTPKSQSDGPASIRQSAVLAPTSTQSSSSSSGGFFGSLFGANTEEEESPIMAYSNKKPWYVGPVFSYGHSTWTYGATDAQQAKFNGNTFYRSTVQGSSYAVGWSMEYLLGRDAKSSTSSMIFEVLFEHSQLSASARQLVNVWNATSFDSTTANATIDRKSDLSLLRFAMSYRFNLGSTPLGIDIGIDPGVVLNSRTTDIATVDSSKLWMAPTQNLGETVDQSGRKLYLKDGAAVTKSFALGLHVGLQYEFILKRFTVIPFVYYKTEIISLDNGAAMSGYGFGLRFCFPIKVL